MNCPKCNKLAKPEATFCGHCGQPLISKQPIGSIQPNPVGPIAAKADSKQSIFRSKKLVILISASIVVGLIVIGIGGLIASKKLAGNSSNSSSVSKSTNSNELTSEHEESYSGVEGKIEEIKDDLGLYKLSDTDKMNGISSVKVSYFSAGIFKDGEFKGYKRIVMIADVSYGMQGYTIETLATKDDKHYVLDGDPIDAKYLGDNFNTEKVTKVANLPFTVPVTLSLDKNFGLARDEISVGYDNHNYNLLTDFSQHTLLKTLDSGLKVYQKNEPPNEVSSYSSPPSKGDQGYQDTVNKYVSESRFIVADPSGLAYSYSLDLLSYIEKYASDYKTYLSKLKLYDEAIQKRDQLEKSGKKEEVKAVKIPERPHIYPPSLSLEKKIVKTNEAMYDEYWSAFRGFCALNRIEEVTIINNLGDSDLRAIGHIGDLDVKVLADKNHSLNKLNFYRQIALVPDDLFGEFKLTKPSSYDDYLSHNPLVFVKGPDGKLLALSENHYNFEQCAKPVVYLYPEKATEVKASFLKPMKLDTTIPTYHNGWDVLAYPDGTLRDLQTKFTDCDKINTAKFGSEYAKKACLANSYPYLYWAGESFASDYPKIDEGWVVDKAGLEQFLNQKLDEIGLLKKEKEDMLSYWLPRMLSRNAPFYRISFLQTEEMNRIAPMEIYPKPNSVNRIFLDFLPLQSKPCDIPPQVLKPFRRDGFTVVEWGGLNR